MKAKPIFIAVAAMFSAAAIAGGDASNKGASQGSSSEQHSQQQSQSQGQNPETVKQAQEKLSAAGLDVGQPDGKMGPKTQAALKEFQEQKGLQASGQLDQETLAALEIGTPEGTTTSSSAGSSPESSSAGSSSAGSPSSSSSSGSAGGEQKSESTEQPKSQ